MKLHLIKGQFTSKEAIALLTKMIDLKIRFQEEKIKSADSEEDIKMREGRIKSLQKELYESRTMIEASGGTVSLEGEITLTC